MTDTRQPGCARVRARLALALDGGLTPLEAALDRGHLEACLECQREQAQHLHLLSAIRTVSLSSPRELELVSAAVLARLSALPRARPVPRWAGFVAVAAAAAILFLLLFGIDAFGSTPRSVDLATMDRFLDRLPSWSEVVRGLASLSRRIS